MLADGWRVFVGAWRTERMALLAAAGAKPLALDVTEEASMTAAIAAIVADGGRLDALVNNAGYGSYGSLEDVPLEEGRRQFEVNVFGLARLTQLSLPIMRAQRSGRIVNITSVGGKMHEPFGAWYHATKFAVEGMSDCLRMELAPFGIDVVVIEPGAIKTEWTMIAHDNLLKYSGAGPYAKGAAAHARMLAAADTSRLAPPPAAVAATVSRALAASRPRTRYPPLAARQADPVPAALAVARSDVRRGHADDRETGGDGQGVAGADAPEIRAAAELPSTWFAVLR